MEYVREKEKKESKKEKKKCTNNMKSVTNNDGGGIIIPTPPFFKFSFRLLYETRLEKTFRCHLFRPLFSSTDFIFYLRGVYVCGGKKY